MLVSTVFALFVAGAYAAPQYVMYEQQQPFSISALEEHLSSVPEGSHLSQLQLLSLQKCRRADTSDRILS